MFEQAGRNASITEISEWVSAWPKKELDELVADFPDLMDDWNENLLNYAHFVMYI